MDETKRCPCCGEDKARDAFAVDRRSPTGLQFHCRDCQAAKRRERVAADPEAERARQRARRDANRERYNAAERRRRNADIEKTRAAGREQMRRWRAENPDRERATRRAFYRANADKRRAESRAWAAANPGKVLAREARRRGAKIVVVFSLEELYDHLHTQGIDPEKCLYCGDPRQEWDHATALALGGSHTVDNVVPACSPCNTKKSHGERAESQRRRSEGLAS